jgi:hypothetical protein
VNLNLFAIYEESNGLVDIELETTVSPLGFWKLQDVELRNAYSGNGYWEFTGHTPVGGDPASPLVYEFTINKGGLYYLHLRCAKEVLEVKGKQGTDVANDFISESKVIIVPVRTLGMRTSKMHRSHCCNLISLRTGARN